LITNSLYLNSTFNFHYYSNIKNGIPPEINKYGKGKWTMEKCDFIFFDKQKILMIKTLWTLVTPRQDL
jgi:hypothetical protein